VHEPTFAVLWFTILGSFDKNIASCGLLGALATPQSSDRSVRFDSWCPFIPNDIEKLFVKPRHLACGTCEHPFLAPIFLYWTSALKSSVLLAAANFDIPPLVFISLGMPKRHKKVGGNDEGKIKGKNKSKKSGEAPSADDDFKDMLAELRAADRTIPATNTTATGSSRSSSSSSSSSSSTSSGSSSTAPGTEVTEAMIAQASTKGDMTQLLQWGSRGVRVNSGELLCQAVVCDMIGAMRFESWSTTLELT
jgi:hypothetical protein